MKRTLSIIAVMAAMVLVASPLFAQGGFTNNSGTLWSFEGKADDGYKELKADSWALGGGTKGRS